MTWPSYTLFCISQALATSVTVSHTSGKVSAAVSQDGFVLVTLALGGCAYACISIKPFFLDLPRNVVHSISVDNFLKKLIRFWVMLHLCNGCSDGYGI